MKIFWKLWITIGVLCFFGLIVLIFLAMAGVMPSYEVPEWIPLVLAGVPMACLLLGPVIAIWTIKEE